MKSLPQTLLMNNIPVKTFSLDTLIDKHKHTPQDECPLVSEGHGAHHGDDHQEEGHGGSHHEEDHHDDAHDDSNDHGDGHGGDHNKHDDKHQERKYNEDDHMKDDKMSGYQIQDLQTDKLSFHTIAKKYSNNFARPSRKNSSVLVK